MRTILCLLIASVLVGCSNGGSKGGGGLNTAANCATPAGCDIIPDDVTALTPKQKERVKILMENMDNAEKVIFENSAVKNEQQKAKRNFKADLSTLSEKVNSDNCTIETKFPSYMDMADTQKDTLTEIKISGGSCPVEAHKLQETKNGNRDPNTGSGTSTSTSKSNFKILDSHFQETLDVYESQGTGSVKSSQEIDMNAGTMKMSGQGSGGGYILSKTEGRVEGKTTMTTSGGGKFSMGPEAMGGNHKLDMTSTTQMVLKFSDFTFYAESVIEEKGGARTGVYKINGEEVTEKEWNELTGFDISVTVEGEKPGQKNGGVNNPDIPDLPSQPTNPTQPTNPAQPNKPAASDYFCSVTAVQGRNYQNVNVCLDANNSVNSAKPYNGGQLQATATKLVNGKFTLTVQSKSGSKTEQVNISAKPAGSFQIGQDTISYYCQKMPAGADPKRICN